MPQQQQPAKGRYMEEVPGMPHLSKAQIAASRLCSNIAQDGGGHELHFHQEGREAGAWH